VFSESGVVSRSELLLRGFTRGSIDHAVASGRLRSIHRGIYLDTATPTPALAALRAHLRACGPEAVVSHVSAARLHRFDSTRPWSEASHITAPASCGIRASGPECFIAHTSIALPTTTIDGFAVTSRARTVLDLAATTNDVECERVLESALRGDNPKRPDQWRVEVLDELLELLRVLPRHRGTGRVRRVLRLRPDGCRPTGSFPETVFVQALRALGIEAIRQPNLAIHDEQGRRFQYFPDLLVVAGRCIVEIDGSQHLLPDRSRSDAARQNRLVGFHVFRYPATMILDDPVYAAKEVASQVKRVRNSSLTWTAAGRCVSGSGNAWEVVPSLESH
jgi:very-short-patch-repair endonuclease